METMKEIHLVTFTTALLLAACGNPKSDTVSLSGTIQGLGNDTVYLYGTDRMYNRIDTLLVKGDKFAEEIDIDTLISAWLQFSNGTEYPIFLNKADKIVVSGSAKDLDRLTIQGNPANEELTRFHQQLDQQPNVSERKTEKAAEDFIQNHPTSLASIYVLEHYFVQQPAPDFTRIRKLTEQMAGILKDRLYMENLLDYLEALEKVTEGKTAPFFQIPGTDGKDIRRTDFKDKYLLLYFWASWNESCAESNQALRQLYKEKKNRKDLKILGISLDIDKQQWEDAITRDTLDWKQACDFKGWNSNVVSQFAVRELPANVLLAPNGRIEGRNLTREQIEKKLIEIASKKK